MLVLVNGGAEPDHLVRPNAGHRLSFRSHVDGMGPAGLHGAEHFAGTPIYFCDPAFAAVRNVARLRADPEVPGGRDLQGEGLAQVTPLADVAAFEAEALNA